MRLPPSARVLLCWLLTRSALLLCVFGVLTLRGPDVTTDVSVIYQGWAEILRSGSFPRDDVTWQYPPGAALPVLAPDLLPFLRYEAAFFVLACVADAVVLGLLLRRPASRAGAWTWVAGVPLLGPTVYARYDLMVTAVAVAAVLAVARHPRTAGALIALGALVKVWPALLLAGVRPGRGGRRLAASALVTAGLLAAVLTLAAPHGWDFLFAQRDRGLEVESVGALVFHLGRYAGWEGYVSLHYGSMEFLGPHVSTVATASLLCTVAALGWLVRWRLRVVTWQRSTAADAALAAVLLFTVTSRVISPQYLVWLVGLAAAALALGSARQRVPAGLILGATALTVLEFPLYFDAVVASEPLGVTLLVLRNGLLLAAAALSCAALWRSTAARPGALDAVATEPVRAGSPR
ncbi:MULTISPECIES: glycosyltransferase family 87 protein [unclassified Streptomyces]|uniref:glycosyltransferase family 87 protein n=1 Tax=unclassified Streptomyces TaxID=2593676 RepID=UPI0022B67F89|nr:MULTISPECIES: glycosyltransferase family 87 protein [unclassified Streptomyces]MCZ7413850.1 glycosyltransferase family 87 protein [Streptomyces sp. WMMC897]MCZ7430846.1 glycosyltransferase family 87 protein [Streptomyces sp. WMMC1477]